MTPSPNLEQVKCPHSTCATMAELKRMFLFLRGSARGSFTYATHRRVDKKWVATRKVWGPGIGHYIFWSTEIEHIVRVPLNSRGQQQGSIYLYEPSRLELEAMDWSRVVLHPADALL